MFWDSLVLFLVLLELANLVPLSVLLVEQDLDSLEQTFTSPTDDGGQTVIVLFGGCFACVYDHRVKTFVKQL